MNSDVIILVSSGNGRLHVRLAPTIQREDFSRVFAAIKKLAVLHQATELLIDASPFQQKLGVFQRLQMILVFVTNLRGYRVAGVISETTIDPEKLGETMARNRGANVKVFTSVPAARAWLGWEKLG